jgi:hypothetical protein
MVVSIACMIVASMIEIVIATRLTVGATRSGAPLTSCSVLGGGVDKTLGLARR